MIEAIVWRESIGMLATSFLFVCPLNTDSSIFISYDIIANATVDFLND